MIDNNFCVRLKKQELTEEEYIEQKEEYLKTGDAKIIILCTECTTLGRYPSGRDASNDGGNKAAE